ncbi:MAG: CDP-alcohol phosphatidyltransferase family protein [Alphaproteobacteria bacterium]|nr:CDP-alcohol phosphatidyltransferase family protein [Alphaproteobacteria bacterium]
MTARAAGIAVVGLGVGSSGVPIWGMTTAERYRRALARAGVTLAEGDVAPDGAERVLLLRLDYVMDENLLADLARAEPMILLDDDGRAAAAMVPAGSVAAARELLAGRTTEATDPALAELPRRKPVEVTSAYRNALRKRADPYALRLSPATRRDIEWRMFMGAYKGATDFVTKYCWPRIAVHVTRWCADRAITPNMVTWVSLLFVILAFLAFWNGWFLTGCLCAWIMTFLDTVDGKLARVTLTSSKLGDVFDHGIDMISPPFWYWAWIVGLHATGMPLGEEILILLIVIGGYVLGRLQEGYFLWRFGIEIHVWQALDTRFRLITARRNPNVAILMFAALFGRPDLGMALVALWTLVSLAFHFLRIFQAEQARARGGAVRSWLADPAVAQAGV